MRKVLICDDDPVVHESLTIYLKKEGFESISAYDGESALLRMIEEKPDLVVLDIMMPKLDGLEVCREVRKTSMVPILMLTAKGEEIDRIIGLELGADDYIVKPFSPREVVARIKAVCRRMKGDFTLLKSQEIRLGDLEISMVKYQVLYKGEVVIATPKEVEILHMLVEKPGQVFTREQILNRIWGYDFYGDTRTVDTHIKKIRSKLPWDESPWNIQTVYGVGYKFEVQR